MRRHLVGLAAATAIFAGVTQAATTSVLHSFGEDGVNVPERVIQGEDGNLYGIGYIAPDRVVYQVTPAGTFSVRLRMRTDRIALARGGDGKLHGTGEDQLFRLEPDGGISVLHVFDDAVDGTLPGRSLVKGGDGNWYGAGFHDGDGTLYRFDPDTGVVTTLKTFANYDARMLAVGGDGLVYGVTCCEGADHAGSLFRILASGEVVVLHAFDELADGADPRAIAQAPNGTWYGVARIGGPGAGGTLFQLTPDGVFGVVAAFDHSGIYSPNDLVAGPAGKIYGVADGGTSRPGSAIVFRFNPANERLGTLHTFGLTPDDAAMPVYLDAGVDGNLYGVSFQGGAEGKGTVFAITQPQSGLVDLTAATWEPRALDPYCVTAGVLDGENLPVANANVTFARSGLNPAASTMLATGVDDTVDYCWSSGVIGRDVLTAAAEDDSATALVDWGARPVSLATKGYIEVLAFKKEYSMHPMATMTDAVTGAPVAGRRVEFSANQGWAICSALTDAHGVAQCKGTFIDAARVEEGRKYHAMFRGDRVYGFIIVKGAMVCVGKNCVP